MFKLCVPNGILYITTYSTTSRLFTYLLTPERLFKYVFLIVSIHWTCLCYRESRLEKNSMAEFYLDALYSRPCCGRTGNKFEFVRRTVRDIRVGTNNGRVEGGSRRCSEPTSHSNTICDEKHAGYCFWNNIVYKL